VDVEPEVDPDVRRRGAADTRVALAARERRAFTRAENGIRIAIVAGASGIPSGAASAPAASPGTPVWSSPHPATAAIERASPMSLYIGSSLPRPRPRDPRSGPSAKVHRTVRDAHPRARARGRSIRSGPPDVDLLAAGHAAVNQGDRSYASFPCVGVERERVRLGALVRAAVAASFVFALACGAGTYAYLDARPVRDPSAAMAAVLGEIAGRTSFTAVIEAPAAPLPAARWE
jgi:hypothetical protein